MSRCEKKKQLFSKAEKLEKDLNNLEKQRISAQENAKHNDKLIAEKLASEVEGLAELGDIDDDPYLLEDAEYIKKASDWKNKQRVLLFCSRGVTSIARHLLSDLKILIPHHVSEVFIIHLIIKKFNNFLIIIVITIYQLRSINGKSVMDTMELMNYVN